MNCLIDTGSTITVMHPDKLNLLPVADKPKIITDNVQLKMADGGVVCSPGYVHLPLEINGHIFQQRTVIAAVEAPLVLGYDFLSKYNCQIDITGSNLFIAGQRVKGHLESELPSVFRIILNENVVIPPRCEMIINASVVDFKRATVSEGIIEPLDSKLTEKGILVGKSLVNLSSGQVPIRIANFNDQAQTLYKHTCAAKCEPVTKVHSMVEYQEKQHCHTVRQIQSQNCETNQEIPEHLQILWSSIENSLDQKQAKLAREVILKHSHVFAKSKDDLGRTSVVQHKIDIGNAIPVRQPPRRLPIARKEMVENEIKRMLQNDIIEPSNSPWASGLVVVEKKDGTPRLCVDYRRLNEKVLKRDCYPIPRIDESIDTLTGSKWFSTLDLASGYWQVEVNPEDKEKTAFSTHMGLFQFNVMPFGLSNAPATFERLMESVLSGLHWQTCLVYLDDIIVFSDTFESHIERLSKVLERIEKAGLKISPKKCQLFQHKVNYLGHIVSSEGVATDPSKVEAVQNWPQPRNVHDVRSFLGTCSYYRRFIKGFAHIAKPLHKLTEKNNKFSWSSECEQAFQLLKNALVTSPILGYPSLDEMFILDTDASAFGIGAVLSQTDGKTERVIAYYSKSLSKSERNYCVTRRELLAIIESVKHFHHYLYGKKFLIRTDHGALRWVLKFKNPEGQVARWLQILSTYVFDIQHRPGSQHGNADGLSRRPCTECTHCERQEVSYEHGNTPVHATVRMLSCSSSLKTSQENFKNENTCSWFASIPRVDITESQKADPNIGIIYKWKKDNIPRPKWEDISHMNSKIKSYWSQWDRIVIENDILYRKWFHIKTSDVFLQLVLPENHICQVLTMLHSDPISGHLGVNRTIAKVRQRFYWVGIKQDVSKFCQECIQCQSSNPSTSTPKAPMKQYIVGAPLERVALDLVGPLIRTPRGKSYILVIADYFTRWTEAFALPNIEARTVAKVFVFEFICRFGVPRQVHTDQGTQFEGKLFQEMCSLFRIDKTRTTTFHPQSDGLVERFNRTLKAMLTKFVSQTQRDWDIYLPLVLMAYRTSVHDSTGFSPSLMMLGREPELPIDLLFGSSPATKSKSQCSYVQNLQKSLWEIHSLASGEMIKASDRQKRYYDHNAKNTSFQEGDNVWLCNKKKKGGIYPKFTKSWEGPYTIVSKLSDLVYKIKSTQGDIKIVHHNLLKIYHGK